MYRYFILFLPSVGSFLFPTSNFGCGCSPPAVPQCPPPAPCPAPPPCRARGEKTYGPNGFKTVGLQQIGTMAVVDTEVENLPTLAYMDDDLDLIYGDRHLIRRRPRRNKAQEKATDAISAPSVAESDATSAEEPDDLKCNSRALRKLMLENIQNTTSMSKRKINKKAEELFGGSVDVICSRGHFSYIYSSNLYCETTKNEITCIAFRQAS